MLAPGSTCVAPVHDVAEEGASLRYVARQPILDARGNVHAYELLFRHGPEAAFRGDSELATQTMIDNTVLFGLEQLTGTLPAFVNCTAEALTGELPRLLPPYRTVLEILETVDPTLAVVEACRALKGAGFRLALDDFVWSPAWEPLIELADYVKVDFQSTGQAERRRLVKSLHSRSRQLLAEKVETEQEYRQALGEGFTLFQGYFFHRPTLLLNRKIPANRLFHFDLLRELSEDPLDVRRLSKLIKRDPSLTYRLLRLVNSPLSAIRQEVTSIQSALIAVGDEAFRRVATLAISCEWEGRSSAEVLRMAFVRARFCELAAPLRGLDPFEQFLLGMLSLVPGLLRVRMEEVIAALPLRQPVRDALLGSHVEEAVPLGWVQAAERGAWNEAARFEQESGLSFDRLYPILNQAVLWAEANLTRDNDSRTRK